MGGGDTARTPWAGALVKPLLSLVGVSKSFWRGPRELPVLRNVSFDVCAGELVGFIASRAAGKTTLLRVAAGLQHPDEGQVLFGGMDMWDISDRHRSNLLSEQIGWAGCAAPELDVPVSTLVAMRMFDVLGRTEAYTRAQRVLERLGVVQCSGQRWESLADWERALVALAEGVVRAPRLLLVDDLTATLGLQETAEVMGLLREFARDDGASVLMGVSDANATSAVDRLGTLAGGELLMATPTPTQRDNLIDFPGRAAPTG